MMPTPIDLSNLARTTDEIYSLDELRARLALNRPLRIKYGVDVTAPDLHLGHAVNVWMMRRFQEHGHKVVFLIGDFTTRIGDPTGRSLTRRLVAPEEIERNLDRFLAQVGLVLLTDPSVFEVRRNSEWFGTMELGDFLAIASLVTHSQLIKRDMFQKRIQDQAEIYIHEMLYPLLQGYDSYMLDSDLTIVGSDQLFNELMGRIMQEKHRRPPQVVLTTRITPGTDGREKQSKSLGNYIALADPPREKFGKLMSIPDSLIVPYLEVYSDVPMAEVDGIGRAMAYGQLHPMVAKKRLATAVVARYHGEEEASREEAWFTAAFSVRDIPDDIPQVRVQGYGGVLDLLSACLPDHSKAALKRLVDQGGVRLNQRKIVSISDRLEVIDGDTLKVGKTRWFKLVKGQEECSAPVPPSL
jgi:tyrosyl-tRNA synthetase